MSAATDTFDIKMLMVQLEAMIDSLVALLDSDTSLLFVGYEAVPVSIDAEEVALADGQQTIEVKLLDTWEHRYTVLNYFKRFYVADGFSTRFVSRMPGLIQTTLPATVVITLIKQINAKKDEIQALVQKNRNHQQRHEFIHETFPQIMTEQVYRHLRYTLLPIKSVWFRWKCKLQTNKTYSNDAAIQWLHEQRHKPKGLYLLQEWEASIDAVINDIASGKFKHVQRERQYRTFPDCHYSFYEYDDVRKTMQYKKSRYSAHSPWILLKQPNHNLPGGTPLRSFDVNEVNSDPKKNKNYLFPPLKIIGVEK